jgi:hypothetical protein
MCVRTVARDNLEVTSLGSLHGISRCAPASILTHHRNKTNTFGGKRRFLSVRSGPVGCLVPDPVRQDAKPVVLYCDLFRQVEAEDQTFLSGTSRARGRTWRWGLSG